MIRSFAIAVSWGCFCLLSFHASANEALEQVTAKIEKYIESNPAVRLDVALVHRDETLFQSGFGSSKQGAGESFEPLYRIGSVTKIFTALAVMQLENDELIDIDQPVFAYLPRFSVKRRFSDVNPITIRHLLTHHSGLPTNIVKGQWSNDHFTTVIEQLRNEYMSYPPNFVYAYSNIGYSLLGALIEEVSGQSYESYVEENILDPLGMTNSMFWSAAMNPPQLVVPADGKGDRRLLPIRDVPAMGLYSNAADMARFLKMIVNSGSHEGRQIIHPVILEQMMERSNEDVSLDYDHQVGIGLLLNHCSFSQASMVVEHGGQTMHYTSHFVAVPEYGTAAIVLSNSSRAKKFVHATARELVAAALNRYYPDVQEEQPVILAEESPGHKDNNVKAAGPDMRARYLTKSGLLTLQVDESDMCACMMGKRFDLVPAPEGWYGIKSEEGNPKVVDVAFSPQEVEGEKVLAARKGDREERLGEYIPDEGIPPSWKERIGDYQVENPDADFPFHDVCLMEEDNMLFLSYRMPLLSDKRIDIPLTALDDTQAITSGLGRGRGETVLVERTAEGEYLLYSGYLVRKIAE